MSSLAVILPAAGRSTRFGRNKLTELLDGVPVIVRALRAFRNHPSVAGMVVATSDPMIAEVIRKSGLEDIAICPGGATRADSVRSALNQLSDSSDWVAVHDAARPLVSRALIDRTFAAAIEHGAAVPAMPVTLTIKQATGPLPAKVQRTIARNALWAMQTPQIARRVDLLDAFDRCPISLDQVTDDVQLLELQGKDVWLVPGDEQNLKITTEIDLNMAEIFLRKNAER